MDVYPSSLSILGVRAFVNGFFKKFPQYSEYKTNRPKDYTEIIKAFHSDLIQAVIDNRYGANMPLKFGNLKLVAFKRTRDYPNFNLYRQGKVGGFTNNHTDGLSCKIVYTNKSNRFKLKDKIMWAFYPEDIFSKRVSKAFSQEYQKYIISPNIRQIQKKEDFFKWKQLTDDHIEEYLKSYNEFEIN